MDQLEPVVPGLRFVCFDCGTVVSGYAHTESLVDMYTVCAAMFEEHRQEALAAILAAHPRTRRRKRRTPNHMPEVQPWLSFKYKDGVAKSRRVEDFVEFEHFGFTALPEIDIPYFHIVFREPITEEEPITIAVSGSVTVNDVKFPPYDLSGRD